LRSPRAIVRPDAIGRTEERREPEVHQIDVRERQNELGVQDHTTVQEIIEHVQKRRIGIVDDAGDLSLRRRVPDEGMRSVPWVMCMPLNVVSQRIFRVFTSTAQMTLPAAGALYGVAAALPVPATEPR
jgi:hypothetical protein